MGRPPKPIQLAQGHRTNSEKNIRAEGEKSLLTGEPIRRSFNAKEHPVAYKEFKRIIFLLDGIGKNDDLYGQIINTHCLLVEECEQIYDIRQQFISSKTELEKDYHAGLTGDEEDGGLSAAEYYRMLVKLAGSIIDCDKQLMAKRKMILDISKENIMTVQSALRSIPKKPEEKKDQSGMAAFMSRRQQTG